MDSKLFSPNWKSQAGEDEHTIRGIPLSGIREITSRAVPFAFDRTSLLIAVAVSMETVCQVHSHLLTSRYEGWIKKAKLRGRPKDKRDEDGEEP